MPARATIVRKGRAKSTARPADARGFERRRGLMSFLTWAFFLNEVLGRDAIGPAAARASDAEAPPSPYVSDGRGPENAPADRAPPAVGDEVEPVAAGPASDAPRALTLSGPAFGPPRHGADGADGAATRLAGPADASGAGAPGSPGASLGAVAAHRSDVAPSDSASGDADPVLALAIAPEGLLHGIADTLEQVPVVGGLLGSSVDTVASTVGSLLGSVAGILGSDRPGEGVGEDAVAADGSLVFDEGSGQPPPDAIYSAQGFTDYGLALDVGLPGGSVASGASAAAAPEPFAVMSEVGAADAASTSVPSLLAGLADEAGQRSAADVLG